MSKRTYKLPNGYTLFVLGKGTERQLRLSVSKEKEPIPVYEEIVFESLLEMVDRLRKEHEEAQMIRFPRQPSGKYGWKLDFNYLQKIQAEMQRETEHSINLEEIEAVLLTLERVGQEGNQDE